MSLDVGFVGLGRMGFPMCQLFRQHGIRVVSFDRNPGMEAPATTAGLRWASSLTQLVETLAGDRRVIWLMIPAGPGVDDTIDAVSPLLRKGDLLVDGGNSSYIDSRARRERLAARGVFFVGCGTSGGVAGARTGPPMSLDCDPAALERLQPYLRALGGNFVWLSEPGGGHLAKAIHNAVEYGMMQSLAEGVAICLRHGFSQEQIAEIFKVWSRGSIIESRLVNCLLEILARHSLAASLTIKRSETAALVEEVLPRGMPCQAIRSAVASRRAPESQDPVVMSVLSLLRHEFGGHETVAHEAGSR